MKRLLALGVLLVLSFSLSVADEIGYLEDFALAQDRAEALKLLIPGTEDYYYYHCLHFLNTEQYAPAEALTRPWLERHGRTPRLVEIQTRHALLTYEQNPQRTLDFLRRRLDLTFIHQKETVGVDPTLPTALDANLYSRATLRDYSLRQWGNLENFEDQALSWLAAEKMGWEQRRNLLQRLTRPDLPNLVELMVEDLSAPHAPNFGTYPVQAQMTLAQLDELARRRGELLNHPNYVQYYVSKLKPDADAILRWDPKETAAYFDRLWAFVQRLAPAQNSLKAHVLYHRLSFDRSRGTYDKARFIDYLRLPRNLGYVARPLLEQPASRQHPVDLNARFQPHTGMPPIGNDEGLVRAYLQHFFVDANDPSEFAPYIDAEYLKQLFAETKIENGLGNAEQWASDLPPERFRALRDRIDIDFAPTNPLQFATADPVRLELFIKNVPTLIVKVFEINTSGYYRANLQEVNTDINLDGLVANSEQTHAYNDPPLRRVKRAFEFPSLNKPGVYVIDFIGAGKSSRVVVRKGRLTPLDRIGSAGVKVMVLDESRKKVPNAKLWLGGQEYAAAADGIITVPFSSKPGRKPIVLSHGDFACLDYLEHPAETYGLQAGIHVEREALLTQRVTQVLVRPNLRLAGQPVSIKLLEEVRLRLTSVDLDGISSVTEVTDFQLFEDRESIHDFRVSSRLATLKIELLGKVKNLSKNEDVPLATAAEFSTNGILKSDRMENLYLARFGSDYVVELRGRSGEPRPHRAVQLSLKHRDFRQPVTARLKTDERGRVHLGALTDVTEITATGPETTEQTWQLLRDQHTQRQIVHVRAETPIAIPYFGAAEPSREELALFEVREGVIRTDEFDRLRVNARAGFVEIPGLPAGDYVLELKRAGSVVNLRVVGGAEEYGYLLGTQRYLETPRLQPLQISELNWQQDGLTVQLQNVNPFTRVHVFAVRYRPEFSAFANLSRVRDRELDGVLPAQAESAYVTGRDIGDEFRYVLDRRLAVKFPGNLLARPELLLNPWAIRSTETGEQEAKKGTQFAPGRPPPASAPVPPEAESPAGAVGRGFRRVGAKDATEVSPNLDFLADAAAVAVNLVPEADGTLRIPGEVIGKHAWVQVVAVDPTQATVRYTARAEQPLKLLDMRLRAGLDPQRHFTQQKAVSILEAGKPFEVADMGSSRFEAYDSLAKVYTLYSAITKDATLAEFGFIVRWPSLKEAEKRELYSRYACHELNFFLFKKDPEFFAGAVRPFLANKKHKTFLDFWLLEIDLNENLEPWRHGRLNVVEQILLARRIPQESPNTVRHLRDRFRLLPPNLELALQLFNTAIKGGELGATDEMSRRRSELREAAIPLLTDDANMRFNMMDTTKEKQGEKPAADREQGKAGKAPARSGRTRDEQRKLEESIDKDGGGAGFEPEDRNFFAGQVSVPQLYRRLTPTMEWAENNYYKVPIAKQVAELVTVNPFWLDYAEHDNTRPFLSKNFAFASRNFTEMMYALALLDLPFTAGKHDLRFEDTKLTFTPASPVIAVHEEVRPVDPAEEKLPILVSQNFYRTSERYREEAGERVDRFITDEFVIHTAYGCQVVVTNPTSARQKLTLLLQLPVGAIPLAGGQFSKSVSLDLEPYRTQALDYQFYFPAAGSFQHLPVQVAKNERLVAAAAPFVFKVVDQPSQRDTTSWDHVSQHGTSDEVLAFLERENVLGLNLDKIAFRMKDRAFFEKTLALLRSRHVYQPTLWSYAFIHGTLPELREFLLHADGLVEACGGPLVSTPLVIDVVARHLYEHLEYKPLVNARAHALGERRQIVNDRLHTQYHHFLKNLTYQRQLSNDERLALTYYLLLQDRIEEALANFSQVAREQVTTQLQYDYCAAYLAFFSAEPERARPIVLKYANHPVDRWRLAFADIAQQLDEIAGKPVQVADPQSQTQQQTAAAAGEPSFDFTIEGQKMTVSWQTLNAVQFNFYLMDVELLFSRNPFVQRQAGPFASIRPNRTQRVELPEPRGQRTLELPAELAAKNVLIEVVGGGKTRMLPYYAHALDVRVMENFGQVQVTDSASGKLLPQVYVKVYARLADGQVKFYKDGYTDHRGRFDYATVSTPEKQPIQRFALLILSEDKGAQTRDVAPPPQ